MRYSWGHRIGQAGSGAGVACLSSEAPGWGGTTGLFWVR